MDERHSSWTEEVLIVSVKHIMTERIPLFEFLINKLADDA